ncbi:MAG TPA: methylated-DNA--[protein]-cysteine S-methyltransferase [Candidatus Lustribacter sp.]|nr:methylated-DNA--[protein]-cysteine S-methyltransferase [Candidatus Lustribacter sp.]
MTDIARSLATFAPAGLAPPVFGTADVAYVVHDSAVGRVLLAVGDGGALLALVFVPGPGAEQAWLDRLGRCVSPRVLRLPRKLDDARRELDDFLAGTTRDFSVATDLRLATAFQRDVLVRLASTVGYGERSTYGALAGSLGRPTASRAVGSALGGNPLCVVLPCHRIVSSTGALTGYAGGLDAKRYLLELEARHTISG